MSYSLGPEVVRALRPKSTALWVPVVQSLVDRVVSRAYDTGHTIPTEAQLGQEFAVSRSVVREAIKIMEQKGLLRIDRGRGTVVQDAEQWRAFDPEVLEARLRHGDRRTVLSEVLILRIGIEPELAAGAARNATDSDLAKLNDAVTELEAARPDVARYLRCDGAFHDCIAEVSGIHLGRDIIRTIARPVAVQRQLTSNIPGVRSRSHDQHLAIHAAIARRDPIAAHAAMRAHLEWAEQRLDAALSED